MALSKVFSRRANAFALFTCLVTPHFGTAASEKRFVSTCGRCAKPIWTRKARKPEHVSEGLGSDGEWSCLLHGNTALAISTRFPMHRQPLEKAETMPKAGDEPREAKSMQVLGPNTFQGKNSRFPPKRSKAS